MSLQINKILIPLSELKRIFKYNKEMGKLFWIKAPRRGISAGSEAGYIDGDGYRSVGYKGKEYRVHRLIHYLLHGYNSENQIDHRDQNKLNNRPYNLREATHSCNQINISLRSNNTSGVTGVSWCSYRNRWKAQIQRNNGEGSFIGRFKNLNDAVTARYLEEQRLEHYKFQSNSSAYNYLKENNLLEELNVQN